MCKGTCQNNEQSRTVHKSGVLPVQTCRRPQPFLRKLQRLRDHSSDLFFLFGEVENDVASKNEVVSKNEVALFVISSWVEGTLVALAS